MLRELAGEKSTKDRANGPAGFDEAEAMSAGVKNLVDKRDEDDVGADDAGHEQRVSDAEREDDGLLAKIAKTFFHIGVDGEREAGFSDFGIFTRFEGLRGGFRGFGVFTRILAMIERGDVSGTE